jgi:predicted metal-dependent peptidase
MMDEKAKRSAAQAMLALAERKVLQVAPLWGRLLAGWLKVPTRINTLGVSAAGTQITLLYDIDFINSLDDIEPLVAVLHHEIGHIIKGHPWLNKQQFSNQKALLIGLETAANECVPAPEKLPGEPVLLEHFDLTPNESLFQRYYKLCNDERCKQHQVEPIFADNHDNWDTMPSSMEDIVEAELQETWASLDQEERKTVPEEIKERFGLGEADNSRDYGSRSGGVTESLPGANRTATLNWQSLLAPFQTKTRQPTKKWPSRRLPHLLGIAPGRRLRRITKPEVIAAIDTSGSMDLATISAIEAEIVAITKICTVTVIQFDTEITSVSSYKANCLATITGRGGTNFEPVCEYIAEAKADCTIIFTDGYGPAPQEKPTPKGVIWCLTERDTETPVSWGKKECLST